MAAKIDSPINWTFCHSSGPQLVHCLQLKTTIAIYSKTDDQYGEIYSFHAYGWWTEWILQD